MMIARRASRTPDKPVFEVPAFLLMDLRLESYPDHDL
jgi:hypothetical protein